MGLLGSFLKNGLVLFQFKKEEAQNWSLAYGDRPNLLRKWVSSIVLKTFMFDRVPI